MPSSRFAPPVYILHLKIRKINNSVVPELVTPYCITYRSLSRRFNLYLKLFIVMGINWSMEIVSWLFNNSPKYIWYLTDLTNTLQGVIIFLIFVWKDKIRRLLLKRFGCHGRDILSGNSTRSAYHSSTSRTFTTSMAPLQEMVKTYTGEPPRNSKPAANRNDSI